MYAIIVGIRRENKANKGLGREIMLLLTWKNYSCCYCLDADTCPNAWHWYNCDGECIELK